MPMVCGMVQVGMSDKVLGQGTGIISSMVRSEPFDCNVSLTCVCRWHVAMALRNPDISFELVRTIH